MAATITLVDDDKNILTSVSIALEAEGYKVATHTDGQSALAAMTEQAPDLAVLDIKMPGLDVMELLNRLRRFSSVPVIFLTSKDEEIDEMLGLKMGADDYIAKPFSPKELIARVKAVLRRGPGKDRESEQEIIVRGEVVVDFGRREVRVEGTSVTLTATELRLLYFLALHPGRVFTRDHLVSRAIGEDVFVVDRNIDVHIRSVRKKLGLYRDMIETIRGVGYRFREEE